MSNGWEQKRIDRFWSFVQKADGDACWMWSGTKNDNRRGYGTVALHEGGKRTRVGAHRFAWMIAYGPVPDGMFVCHRCDTPGCVRPDHLFIGTAKDNTQDMIAKGRNARGPALADAVRRGRREVKQQRAPYRPQARKLTPELRSRLLERRAAGATHRQLATEFGISSNSVNKILHETSVAGERRSP